MVRPTIKRGTRSIVGQFQRLRGDMDTPVRRFLGFFEHLFIDHAVFRYAYLNNHTIAPGMERAAQPSPVHICAAARRGIKTIINLRGPRACASYLLEKRACAEHGIRLVDFVITSRSVPTADQVLSLDRLFKEVEHPALLHCKSGADRAGLASALYMMLYLDKPVEEALKQLHLRYGHIKQAKTGVLDAFLLAYKRANDAEPIDFRTWLRTEYDPDEVTGSFRSGRIADIFADRVLSRE